MFPFLSQKKMSLIIMVTDLLDYKFQYLRFLLTRQLFHFLLKYDPV